MRRDDGDGEEETTHPLSVSATNGNGIMKVCLSCVYMHASVRACVAACVHACALIHVCLYCNNSPDSFPFSDGDRQGMKLLSRIPSFSYTNATVFDIMARFYMIKSTCYSGVTLIIDK